MKFKYLDTLEEGDEINLNDLYKSIDNLNISEEKKSDLYFHIVDFFDDEEIAVINEKSTILRNINEKIIQDYEIQSRKIFEKQVLEFENKVCKIQNFSELKPVNEMFNFLHQKDYEECYDGYSFCCGYGDVGDRCYIFKEDDEIKIKTFKDNKLLNKFYTKFGLMICENRGEWGGELYNFTEYGYESVGSGNYRYVFEYDNKVYAIASLSHLGSDNYSFHEIRKYSDKFENVTIFESDVNFRTFVEDNYIYLCPLRYEKGGLYRFNLDNYQFEILHEYLCEGLYVNNLIKKDNFIYIYGSYNVVKYNLDTEEVEIYTNLDYDQINNSWYVHDMKLLDIWDKLLDI